MVFGYFPQLCMMQILLVAAKAAEIQLSQDAIAKLLPPNSKLHIHFTGVGLTAATFSITRLALTLQPQLIIQAGIAGTFRENFIPGEVMLVQNESIGDLGVQEHAEWKDVFQLGLTNPEEQPFDQGGLPNPFIQHFSFLQLPAVDAITVNQISTNPTTIARMQQIKPAPVLESIDSIYSNQSHIESGG